MTDTLASIRWIHGAPEGAPNDDPPIQVAEVDPDTLVLRISKGFSFEANFIPLLIGRDRALLLDTGGPPDAGSALRVLPLRETVDRVLAARPRPPAELIVAHSHAHGDHVHWDGQFADRSGTRVIGLGLADVRAFWGLPDWPEGEGTVDLGDRRLTAIPTPGHEATHVAILDHRTGILLTGDILYPGLVTVRDWPAFRASARRMRDLAARHPVRALLGNHVEMSRQPGVLYPLGALFQPDEHPLPLDPSALEELHRLCEDLGDHPRDVVRDRFAIALVPPRPETP